MSNESMSLPQWSVPPELFREFQEFMVFKQFQYATLPMRPKDSKLEEGLNILRNAYIREKRTITGKDEEYDSLEECEINSTSSTKTNGEEKEGEEYLTKEQRLYVLESYSYETLKHMKNWKNKSAKGKDKREVLKNAVLLVKTKTQLIDFILSSLP
ncbi:hypothetical protein TVAG_418190 [Trichomonas vaginalis G3]|uniref:Uncharacterized protein n=1 Tax=Trichomonas vaginalis (strain ATCC PRA-98 / G3) TaxID=412133 RepID=A2GDX1_TRIV3|nr:hypothetical protein TVAGG3_0113290 [Trichomonas vaginalis G3]EAX84648.1 hypothetical protein TVAG_418190 [Trichomonas vaginalis G3]KAI5545058.1 hypothetical protein TVAGG3_0113290 [Trichomonas vaginalis G3]|eukprot:XP_001297578.1 hypothetical protein [Trichomonas vaginalis G3]